MSVGVVAADVAVVVAPIVVAAGVAIVVLVAGISTAMMAIVASSVVARCPVVQLRSILRIVMLVSIMETAPFYRPVLIV